MNIANLKPDLLKRYAQIARLAIRHGGRDWLPAESHAALDTADIDAVGDDEADLARDLEAMGPAFVKIGQLLSTRPDIVPARHLRALKRLRNAVKPFPGDVAEQLFRDQVGVSTDKAFADFDADPIAAASLAQVHRATLRDGTEVAVKLRRPGIRDEILTDLDALDTLAQLADPCHAPAKCLDLPGVVGELRTELDGGALARQFFDAYLHQILIEGCFHADPHPGNVLLTRDRRIGVLDFGMVGRFGSGQRRELTKLLLALGDQDGASVAAVAAGLGTPTARFDSAQFERQICRLVAEHAYAALGEMKIGLIVMQVVRLAAECGLRLPRELTLLGKTLLNLDEVGLALHPAFDPYGAIRRFASTHIADGAKDQLLPNQAFTALADTRELASKLPRRLNTIVDRVADNDIRFSVEIANAPALMTALRRVANRITVGIVIAALIVGAALLMGVDTEFKLMGYPGLAIILFLCAAAGGLAFAVNVLLTDARSAGRR